MLPGAVSAFNVIVMRTFIHSNVPDSLIESARIDGAGEFLLFFRIVLPIMVPSLAAIGFMTAVGHWNEWQTALLYITDSSKATLQLMLIRIESSIAYLREAPGIFIGRGAGAAQKRAERIHAHGHFAGYAGADSGGLSVFPEILH